MDGARVSAGSELADHGAAGVSQAERLGHLVEGLPHRVVDGGAENLVVAPRAHVHEHGVAAGDEARHEGRLQAGRLEEVGHEVALEVVHGNERQVSGRAEALGEGDAHHERTHEARPRRHADGREVGRRQRVDAEVGARLREGLLKDADDGLGVLAAGDLGHDAAEARVEVDLGGHDARAHDAVGVGHGHGRLVAGGLDGEDERAGGGDGLGGLGGARRRLDGPRADGRARRRIVVGVGGKVGERQVGAHDAGVVAGAVVVGAYAGLGKAELLVEALGGGIAHLDLQ